MINAFGIDPAIATKHEAAIAAVMHKQAGTRGLAIRGNGQSYERKTQNAIMWDNRAKIVRKFLEKKPGAASLDISRGLKIERATAIAWMAKFRKDPDYFGIVSIRQPYQNSFKVWRKEDYEA